MPASSQKICWIMTQAKKAQRFILLLQIAFSLFHHSEQDIKLLKII